MISTMYILLSNKIDRKIPLSDLLHTFANTGRNRL